MKRSPLKRKTALKRGGSTGKRARPRKLSAKAIRTRCDNLWSKIIRSVGACELCGATGCVLHAHHLIGRGTIYYRHNLHNGVCLCPSHHMYSNEYSAHGAPRGFAELLVQRLPAQLAWWDAHRHRLHIGEKPNYGARLAGLTALWESIQRGETTRDAWRNWENDE